MKKHKLRLTEKAQAEYIDAFLYYENKQDGLGDRFEEELDELMGLIQEAPLLFSKKYKNFREPILKNFPYLVVFEIVEGVIVVQSIFHAKQNPKKKPGKK
jgi:plasmid stabilization system protein ParE